MTAAPRGADAFALAQVILLAPALMLPGALAAKERAPYAEAAPTDATVENTSAVDATAEVTSTPTITAPQTTITATAYYYAMRDQPDFGVGVASLDRGSLHFEARYNYEARNTTSLFAGWKFAGGDRLSYKLTPIIGGMFGTARGVVPGIEASLAYGPVDVYVEAEYVNDRNAPGTNYTYSWSELGWTPVAWLRVGLALQNTQTVDTGRNYQRGVFAQATVGKATFSVYAFNPDGGSNYLIGALGVQF